MRFLAFVAVVVLTAPPAYAQNVLSAEPSVRVRSGIEETTREKLSPIEGAKNRVIIIRQGDRYLWASREGCELIHVASGAFHYFLDTRGTNYVKVMDTHFLPEDVRPPGPRYHYMEHVTLWLSSITYWGETDKFDLGPVSESDEQ